MSATTSGGPVVVGVDGTESSRAALAFALEEAAIRDVRVIALLAWTFGTTLHDAGPADTYEQLESAAEQQLAARVAEALADLGNAPVVEQRVVHGDSGTALVEAADGAAVLVVGSGRKGPLARAVLGSTSEFCVRHSPVPVLVVPDPACT